MKLFFSQINTTGEDWQEETDFWSAWKGKALVSFTWTSPVFSRDAAEVVFATASLPSALYITWAAWNQSKRSHFQPHLRVRSNMQVKKALCPKKDFYRGCLLQLMPTRKWRNHEGLKLWSSSLHTACHRKSSAMPCGSGWATAWSTTTSRTLRVRGPDTVGRWG